MLNLTGVPTLLEDDVRLAWRHAVRAMNSAENQQKLDTRQNLLEIVAELSQVLEFVESMRDADTSRPPDPGEFFKAAEDWTPPTEAELDAVTVERLRDTVEKLAEIQAADEIPLSVPVCDHAWIDIRNHAVKSGSMCSKCGKLSPDNIEEHSPEKTPPAPLEPTDADALDGTPTLFQDDESSQCPGCRHFERGHYDTREEPGLPDQCAAVLEFENVIPERFQEFLFKASTLGECPVFEEPEPKKTPPAPLEDPVRSDYSTAFGRTLNRNFPTETEADDACAELTAAGRTNVCKQGTRGAGGWFRVSWDAPRQPAPDA